MIKIADLSYLENATENELIYGGVGVVVESSAIAYGDSTYTYTDANTTARATQGADVAIGRGFSLALRDTTTTNVTVDGTGDKVVSSTTSTPEQSPIDISIGHVIAVQLPSKSKHLRFSVNSY
ncbi:hypothetical protein [Dapis sp. BLCC M172]|uniref:hypothetical protein n=1 Tax=Dapis sp. BLCC M172 TaxID=2975281 RepID=UPI003CF5B5B2